MLHSTGSTSTSPRRSRRRTDLPEPSRGQADKKSSLSVLQPRTQLTSATRGWRSSARATSASPQRVPVHPDPATSTDWVSRSAGFEGIAGARRTGPTAGPGGPVARRARQYGSGTFQRPPVKFVDEWATDWRCARLAASFIALPREPSSAEVRSSRATVSTRGGEGPRRQLRHEHVGRGQFHGAGEYSKRPSGLQLPGHYQRPRPPLLARKRQSDRR